MEIYQSYPANNFVFCESMSNRKRKSMRINYTIKQEPIYSVFFPQKMYTINLWSIDNKYIKFRHVELFY